MRLHTLLATVSAAASAAAASSLNDIEHIVVFMQENRAFDHYYGKMKGVRGFNDRSAPPLPTGNTPFYQPIAAPQNSTGGNTNIPDTCEVCVGLDKVWCYQDDVCYDHGDAVDTMPFSCKATATAKLAVKPNASSKYQTSTTATPDGDCCRNGSWVPGICSSAAATDVSMRQVRRQAQAKAPGPNSSTVDRYMLPFHVNLSATSGECMGAPAMSFPTDVKMRNEGRMDAWNTARNPGYGMGYFERSDLPYYYALSDGFTVGDAHFQSTLTQTSPNRMHFFSGSNNNYWNPKGRGSDPNKEWLLMASSKLAFGDAD
eukprot:gene10395-7087_t